MKSVEICEVCPRDGLQPEPVFIETAKKITLVNKLVEAGCKRIEVTSFVRPESVPQMRDAREVFVGIPKKNDVMYSALIPNQKGLEFALTCGFTEVVTVISASESHNKKNVNRTIAESLKAMEMINKMAKQSGIQVRSYISTVFGCPIEGYVDPQKVLDIALSLESFGSYEISLCDTTGVANPESAYRISKMITESLIKARIAVHFHKYYGLEFANTLAAYNAGVYIFDSAAGGLGGSPNFVNSQYAKTNNPYIPGAHGNCATEILTEMFHRMGVETGIDQKKIEAAGLYAKTLSVLV